MGIDRELLKSLSGLGDEELVIFESTGSTNAEAAKLADAGAGHMTAVLAGSQSEGRGRLGRSFYSPEGSGLYMSIIVRPDNALSGALAEMPGLLTVAAGVECAKAIKTASGIGVSLKWVNDIMLRGKKIGGILTESRFSEGRLLWAVIGIGVDLFDPAGGFPKELERLAGSLTGRVNDLENDHLLEKTAGYLISGLRERILTFENGPETAADKLRADYSELVAWTYGRRIAVVDNASGNEYPAVIEGLSEDLGLNVRPDNGGFERVTLRSGNISIRLL